MTRLMLRLLGSALLATLVAGCANTPRAMGIPWWPQGPGNAPDQVRCAEPATATPCPAARSADSHTS